MGIVGSDDQRDRNTLLVWLLVAALLFGSGWVSGCYFNKGTEVPITSSTVDVERNKEEVGDVSTSVVKKHQNVVVKTEVPTERYGNITTTTTIPRKALQYNNTLSSDLTVLNTSLLVDLTYTYKRFRLGAVGGYDWAHKQPVYGAKIGVVIVEW